MFTFKGGPCRRKAPLYAPCYIRLIQIVKHDVLVP